MQIKSQKISVSIPLVVLVLGSHASKMVHLKRHVQHKEGKIDKIGFEMAQHKKKDWRESSGRLSCITQLLRLLLLLF